MYGCIFNLINFNTFYADRYLRSHDPNTSKINMIFDLFIFCEIGAIGFLITLIAIIFLVIPRFPLLLGNVMPTSIPFVVNFLIHIYHLYITLISIMVNIIPLTWIIVYGVFVGPFVAYELKLGRKFYKSSSNLRQFDTLALEYRACQLLQNQFNRLLGRLLIPTELMIKIVFWFTASVSIKHRKDMETLTYILFASWSVLVPLFWSIVLILGGWLHYQGNKVLNSWKYCKNFKNTEQRKFLRLFHLSCKPIFICYGKICIVRKVNFLLFSRSLAKGLMKSLITVK